MNENVFTNVNVITDYKSGITISEIAKKYHVGIYAVSSIIKPLNLPTNRIIKKILANPNFAEYFKQTYTEHNKINNICDILIKHPFFSRINPKSIGKRVAEIRNYFELAPKMLERSYKSEYDRIRGYMIRNSKFMAKRRNIYFDLEY